MVGIWTSGVLAGMMAMPGETELGSAGTQPIKGYSGRGCANGASDP